MTWTVEYDGTRQIIIDTCVGPCSGQDIRDIATKRIALAKEVGSTRTLLDISKAVASSSTISDIYDIVDELYSREGSRVKWKIAIARPESPAAREQASFYVMVCQNRGWRVKDFTERKEAIEWLLQE